MYLQVRDVEEPVPVDPLDVGLVAADGGCEHLDSPGGIFLLDPPQVCLRLRAVIVVCRRLPVRDDDQEPYGLRPCQQALCGIAQGGTVAVPAPGAHVHQPVLVLVVDGIELRIGIKLHVPIFRVAVDGHRDVQPFAEVMQDDGSGAGMGDAVGAAFVI